MRKGKDFFRVLTKDAFAFLYSFFSSPKNGERASRSESLKDALAFVVQIITPTEMAVNRFCKKFLKILQIFKNFQEYIDEIE